MPVDIYVCSLAAALGESGEDIQDCAQHPASFTAGAVGHLWRWWLARQISAEPCLLQVEMQQADRHVMEQKAAWGRAYSNCNVASDHAIAVALQVDTQQSRECSTNPPAAQAVTGQGPSH